MIADIETKPAIILLEDNLAQSRLLKHALHKTGIKNAVIHFQYGIDAWRFVERYEQMVTGREHYPQIGLILLDLHMPGMDGKEFLKLVQDTPVISKTQKMVMTASLDQDELDQCYDYGADYVVQKWTDLEEFRHITWSICKDWAA